MSAVGLITEYNPFHNGHKYHIERAKELTGADTAVVVMSGDFVQRGAPAFIDKYSRTHMALNNGADLVVELPYVYANSSAEIFAYGAVYTLYNLGIDKICFGCETDNIDMLMTAAHILADEPELFKNYVKEYISFGLSFPAAREKAFDRYISENASAINNVSDNTSIYPSGFLNSPNNILAIEYIKCIIRNNLPIDIYPLKRTGNGFHSTELCEYASASAIRNYYTNTNILNASNYVTHNLSEDSAFDISASVPDDVADFFKKYQNITFPVTSEHFKNLIFYKLLSLKSSSVSLSKYCDVSEDLEKRIYNNMGFSIESIDDYIKILKSKSYTYTRIERCLFHILMDYTKEDFELCKNNVKYINVLGFNPKGQAILKKIKKTSSVPIIIKKSDAKKILSPSALKLFEYDLKAMRLYNQIVYSISSEPSLASQIITDDYKRGVIIYSSENLTS